MPRSNLTSREIREMNCWLRKRRMHLPNWAQLVRRVETLEEDAGDES